MHSPSKGLKFGHIFPVPFRLFFFYRRFHNREGEQIEKRREEAQSLQINVDSDEESLPFQGLEDPSIINVVTSLLTRPHHTHRHMCTKQGNQEMVVSI